MAHPTNVESVDEVFEPMKWVKPQFGTGRIDAAGKVLAGRTLPSESVTSEGALEIAGNWRSSHAYPLHVLAKALRRRAGRVDAESLVAQRLKRMPSIAGKLRRFPQMQLSRMQDLGGCRAIMSTIKQVKDLVALYEQTQNDVAALRSKNDYISSPKNDGYRGVHLVYEYTNKNADRSAYNGQRIEIQIRSQLQHEWATAVETIDTFTHQSLKSGVGSDQWKRFFALMGSYGALFEYQLLNQGGPVPWQAGSPVSIIPNTPSHPVALIEEAMELAKALRVQEVLEHLAVAVKVISTQSLPSDYRDGYYLMVLELGTLNLSIGNYADSSMASEQYIREEKKHAGNPAVQVVMVSVESMSDLKRAFPNYFDDAVHFLGTVQSLTATLNMIRSKRDTITALMADV